MSIYCQSQFKATTFTSMSILHHLLVIILNNNSMKIKVPSIFPRISIEIRKIIILIQ